MMIRATYYKNVLREKPCRKNDVVTELFCKELHQNRNVTHESNLHSGSEIWKRNPACRTHDATGSNPDSRREPPTGGADGGGRYWVGLASRKNGSNGYLNIVVWWDAQSVGMCRVMRCTTV